MWRVSEIAGGCGSTVLAKDVTSSESVVPPCEERLTKVNKDDTNKHNGTASALPVPCPVPSFFCSAFADTPASKSCSFVDVIL